MPLRIAFDLDGVLADMESALIRQAESLFGGRVSTQHADRGEPPPDSVPGEADASDTAPPMPKLDLSSRQQRKLWEHVASIENFWETLDEVEVGAVAKLAAVAADRRWEVAFLTKRPASAGETAQRQTQRWLQSNGFSLPSVFVVQGSRGRIASALGLDFVVDDRTENCLDVVVDSSARAILVWREAEQQLPESVRRLGIGVVPSVAACLDVLAQIEPGARDDPGMMARVKRLLGIKTSSASA